MPTWCVISLWNVVVIVLVQLILGSLPFQRQFQHCLLVGQLLLLLGSQALPNKEGLKVLDFVLQTGARLFLQAEQAAKRHPTVLCVLLQTQGTQSSQICKAVRRTPAGPAA